MKLFNRVETLMKVFTNSRGNLKPLKSLGKVPGQAPNSNNSGFYKKIKLSLTLYLFKLKLNFGHSFINTLVLFNNLHFYFIKSQFDYRNNDSSARVCFDCSNYHLAKIITIHLHDKNTLKKWIILILRCKY